MTIVFIPENYLPYSRGRIEVQTPVWARQYGKADQYPIGAEGFECTSENFESYEVSVSNQSRIAIEYVGLLGENNDPI